MCRWTSFDWLLVSKILHEANTVIPVSDCAFLSSIELRNIINLGYFAPSLLKS